MGISILNISPGGFFWLLVDRDLLPANSLASCMLLGAGDSVQVHAVGIRNSLHPWCLAGSALAEGCSHMPTAGVQKGDVRLMG